MPTGDPERDRRSEIPDLDPVFTDVENDRFNAFQS